MAHLLLWTAGCGLFLAAVRRLANDDPGAVGSLIVVAACLAPGAAWAGLAVLIGRWARGARWPTEPGHWLSSILGARLAVDLVLRLTLAGQIRSIAAVANAATCCLAVLPLFDRKMARVWKGFFALLVLAIGIPLAAAWAKGAGMDLPAWMQPQRLMVGRWVMAGVVGLVAAADQLGGGRRDWLHWAGLVVSLVLILTH